MTETFKPELNTKTPVVLCLTTLRHQRFVDDVINVVGLPDGAHLRLRYRREFVEPETWRLAAEAMFPEAKALLALGATTHGGKSIVVPMRIATVAGAFCKGDLLILDLALGCFAIESQPHGVFWDGVVSGSSGLPEHFDTSRKSPGNYVSILRGGVATVLANADVSAWETVANRVLQQDEIMHGVGKTCIPFLYFLDGLGVRVKETLKEKGILSIDAGGKLAFDLHSITRLKGKRFREPLGEVLLEISHPSANFVTSRRLRVDSSRDVKQVQLFSSLVFRKTHGHLSVRLVSFNSEDQTGDDGEGGPCLQPGKDRKPVALARYDFPLSVGRWRPILASGALALSTAVLAWESPADDVTLLQSLIVPTVVGGLAFLALAFGLWKDGKSD